MVSAVASLVESRPLVDALKVPVLCVRLVCYLPQLLQAAHALLHFRELRVILQVIRHEFVEKLPGLCIALLKLQTERILSLVRLYRRQRSRLCKLLAAKNVVNAVRHEVEVCIRL